MMSDGAKSSVLPDSYREDIRLVAASVSGATRRGFQAAMAEKYCAGSARRAEGVFGWSRQAVELSKAERKNANPEAAEAVFFYPRASVKLCG